MAETIGSALIEILPDSGKFEEKTKGGLGKALGTLAKVGVAAGAAVGVALAGATLSAASLDDKMRQVVTLFGETGAVADATLAEMQTEVRGLSNEFGIAQETLTGGLYQAISAGVPRDNVFEFMEVASKAAVGGAIDVELAVDGVTTAINAFGLEASDAEAVSDAFFAAVAGGKTTFGELSKSLSVAAPAASAAGVALEEVLAATAAITSGGTPTSVAMTQIRAAINELAKPGTKVAEVFEQIAGQSFREFTAAGGDVQGALALLQKHAEDSGLAIGDFFGSVEAGAAATTLATTGAEKFSEELARQADAAGFSEDAFTAMSEGAAFQMQQLRTQLGNVFTQIGQVILPYLSKALAALQPHIQRFVDWVGPAFERLVERVRALFTNVLIPVFQTLQAWWSANGPMIVSAIQTVANFIGNNLRPVLAALAVVVAAALVPALGSLVGLIAALFSPVILVVGALAALAAGAVWAYENFEGFRDVVDAVFSWFQTFVPAAINTVRNAITTVLTGLQRFWQQWGGNILRFITGTFRNIWTVIQSVMKIIQGVINVVMGLIRGDWSRVWTGIQQIVSGAIGVVRGIVQQGMNFVRNIFPIVRAAVSAVWSAMWESIKTRAASMLASVVTTVRSKLEEVKAFFRSLPGNILGALGNLGNLLLGAGRSLVQGFINGIRNMAGAVITAIRNAITDKLPAFVKRALGISSPSRVFEAFGEDTLRGFQMGLEKFKPQIPMPVIGGDGASMPSSLIGLAGSTVNDRLEALLERIAEAVESGGVVMLDSGVVAGEVTSRQRAHARGQRIAAGTAGWRK